MSCKMFSVTALVMFGYFLTPSSATYNVIIENDTGDPSNGFMPIYEPPGVWEPLSLTPGKGDTNPDNLPDTTAVSMTYAPPQSNGATQLRWMTLLFSGTAIYAEFVLGDGITDLTFHMDDVQLPQGFEYNLPKGAYFNATVYNNSDVTSAGTGPNGTHNLTISSVQRMAFDFAVYTVSGATNASTTTSSSSAPLSASDRTLSTGAIIGVVISALVALCLALVILVICIKKHRHVHKRNPAPAVDPSEVNPSTSVYLSTVVEMMEDAQSALWSTTNGRSSFGGTTSRTTEGATLGELKEQLEHMRITQEQLQQMLKEVQVHLDAPSASRLRETHWRHISWLTQEMAVLRAQAARLDLDSNVHLQAQSPNVAVEKQLSYEMNRDSP